MKEFMTKKELKKIYLILKALDENQLSYPNEEWEMDYYEKRLIDKRGIKRILEKLRRLLPEKDVKEIDKRILLRKYSTFSNVIDEEAYSKIEKAFNNKNRVEIEYFSMKNAEKIKRKIDIYYKSRKYVIAFCHLRNAIRKFRTSRIVSVRLTKEKYSIPEWFDKKEFL